MAQLAIKGHATRGKEVIEILEMLGGKSYTELAYKGEDPDRFYCINKVNNFIDSPLVLHDVQVFTLEEFLEKFPYKVGDRVKNARINDFIGKITNARWDNNEEQIIYVVEWDDATKSTLTYFARGLQPYKEETMKANKEFKLKYCKNCSSQRCTGEGEWLEGCKYYKRQETMKDGLKPIIDFSEYCKDEYLLELGDYELEERDGRLYAVKRQPQYPKTYWDCAKFINRFAGDKVNGYNYDLILNLQRLLICRNAYWKIAGEQMGLGKPWKPDWDDGDEEKFCIEVRNDNELCDITYLHAHRILAFPTMELLDIFAENFKELIEQCKELL